MSHPEGGGATELDRQIEAARHRACLFDYSTRGKVELTGSDRVSFLQGMVTSDVESLSAGEAQRSAVVTAMGKMISSLILLRDRERILLETPPGRAAVVVETLGKYVITEDVELTDATDAWAILSVQGPLSTRLLREGLADGTVLPESNFGFAPLQEPEGRGLLLRHDRFRDSGFDLWLPVGADAVIARRLLELGVPSGVLRGAEDARDALRIAAGRPAWGREIGEERFPGEVGLSSAVSVTKGCYVGQETLARIHHRGHVNRRLVRVEVERDGGLAPGDPLFRGDKQVGELTSVAGGPAGARLPALAVVRREVAREGESFAARAPGPDAVEVRVRDIVP